MIFFGLVFVYIFSLEIPIGGEFPFLKHLSSVVCDQSTDPLSSHTFLSPLRVLWIYSDKRGSEDIS